MSQTVFFPSIRSLEFINSSILFVHLDNDRVFIVPLEKFPVIKNLSADDRKNYEIIDDTHISFLAIDDIFSLEDLIGINIESNK